MKKKPISISVIAFCYLMAPLVYTLQTAYLNHWPLRGPRGVFNHYSTYDWFILICFPLVAVGVFKVARWGNILFLFVSLFIIAHNSYNYLKNPFYSVYVLLLINLGILGIVGFFLQKHIMAAYFNPSLKWWEHPFRYKTYLTAIVKVHQVHLDGRILDLSTGGCFISTKENFKLGESFSLMLSLKDITLEVRARVVWLKPNGPKGYGLMFLAPTKDQKKGIQKLIDIIKNTPSNQSPAQPGIKTA